jgi:peptide-methionine (S)-S-oxide reductase
VFAGGCFWSVEAVFEAVKGVVDVVSGYVGGTAETARYDLVAWAGTTGHAEAVEITFDPNVVSFGQLLRVFFSAAHDATQLDRQYPDVGPQYRSQIFYVSDAQREVARAYIDQIDESGLLAKPIVTRLDPLDVFYWAEEEHQDFVLKNPSDQYVLFYSIPKLLRLGAILPELYRPPWGVAY